MVFSPKAKGEEALVVIFDSTASALSFASAAQNEGLTGRLIPVPRSLSAGCGIAWRDLPLAQQQAEALIAREEIDDARVVIIQLRA